MLAAALYLQRGTPFIFQGEELGMTNVPFPDESCIRDIEAFNALNASEKGGNRYAVWPAILHKGRDNARTPMQWNDGKNAGFCDGEPWIMLNPNYVRINAETEKKDENSVLNFYRQLISLRQQYSVLQYGECFFLNTGVEDVVCYGRRAGDRKFTILCNMSGSCRNLDSVPEGKLVLGNCAEAHEETILLPYETRVYYWDNNA